MMGEFGNRGGKWRVGVLQIHSYFSPLPARAGQTSLGESMFLVNKPQAHNGASNSREERNWCSEKMKKKKRGKGLTERQHAVLQIDMPMRGTHSGKTWKKNPKNKHIKKLSKCF